MESPLLFADWAVAVVVIVVAPLLIRLDRWWVFPAVGAGMGALVALVFGTASSSAAASVVLLAFWIPVVAVIVGYCQNPTARSLTVAGIWLAFAVWVFRALPSSSDTLWFAALVLPVMFLFLLVSIVAYQKGAVDAAARGRTTIELNGLLMIFAASLEYPDKHVGLYVLIAGAVFCFLGLWGLLWPAGSPVVVPPTGVQPPAGAAPSASPVPGTSASTAPPRQYCPSCGSPNEGDSAFCRKCGRALGPPPTDRAGAPPQTPG